MTLFDLSGRVAIVTGGNRGIGLGIARGLADAGASIVIAARDPAASESVVADFRAAGTDACFVPTDVGDETDCAAMVDTALARFGRIDILVNNAGRVVRKAPQDCSLEEWESVLRTNLSGAFLCAKAVFPTMRGQGGGKIVNLGSLASVLGSRTAAAYAASKGGIVQLTRSLAVSWGPDNIQVNAVMPGYTDTDMTKAARAASSAFDEAVLARTPAGRWGTPADLAGVAVFLSSAASDFITGAAIPVDGGYSVQL